MNPTVSKFKVVQLSSVHPSNDTRIFHKICKTLVRAGYDLDLIIQHKKSEVLEGVNIIALPLAEKKSDRLFKIIPTLISKCLKYKKGTVFHFHDPELIPVGFIFKILGYKVIYDVHEDVPADISVKEWIPRFLRRPLSLIVGGLEQIAKRYFDGIVVVVTDVGKRLDSKKTIMVQNFPTLNRKESEIFQYNSTGNLFYVGDINIIRGAFEMIDILPLLNEKIDIRLTLAGRFSPPTLLEELKKRPGWRYVDYIGWISRDELMQRMSESSAGLVLLYPEPHHVRSQPNKLFEYMYGGLPIVSANLPRYSEIISESKTGLTVDPKDLDEIVEAILYIINNPQESSEMGKRGVNAVINKYNWDIEKRILLDFYETL